MPLEFHDSRETVHSSSQLMSSAQRRTLLILVLIALVYFILFIFPNAKGARDENMLRVFSGDETVMYPVIVRMLTTPHTLKEMIFRLLITGDYHYGYPFYFFSMLAALPVKLLYGEAFTAHLALTMLLLRQLISVLPAVLAAGVLVYIQTELKATLRSVLIFVFLLAIPGVVRGNLWWWHPDSLAVLAVCLTLLFLTRDHLALGKNFFLAAVTCGLAIAIKLIGVFFVFPLAAYVLAALVTRRLSIQQALLRSLGFIALMSVVTVLSNPFVFFPGEAGRLLALQTSKSAEMSSGYTHDDPSYYQKGIQWWLPTLESWYGPAPLLLLVAGLCALGCFTGSQPLANRLILGWSIPFAIYLFFFVAVKPDHYWLPVMPALFSGAFSPIALKRSEARGWLQLVFSVVVLLLLGYFLLHSLSIDVHQYQVILAQEALKGY